MKDNTIGSIGIIGLGAFGQFAASLLPQGVRVVGYEPRTVKSVVEQTDLAVVLRCDVVILAIPLDAYSDVLSKIQPMLRPNTLIIDICSVKTEPERLLQHYLPRHPNLLMTHPLFGPESAADGTNGRDLIVTKSLGKKAKDVLEYCRQTLGLSVRRMTPEAHDRAMAQVHVLTFFVARGLAMADIATVPFETPSFQMILDLVSLDRKHSDELFRTIQAGNPHAQEVRERLVKSFEQLALELKPKE